jgi:transposase
MYDQGFRIAALKLYNYIGNMRKTADALNIGVATIWRWIHKGIIPMKRQKISFPETLVSFVKCSIESQNHITQLELISKIKTHLGVHVSRKCLSTVIKVIGFSRKRLRKRGFTKETKYNECIKRFKETLISMNHDSIVSIDEIGFDQRMTPLYGYSLKGTKAIGFTHPTNRKRKNVIMAIDATGKKYFKIIDGPVNASIFQEFISNIPWSRETTLIMDNVAFHKSQVVKEKMNQRGFLPLFIPPYSPDCNPIENIFSVVKNRYRKLIMDLKKPQIKSIEESINSVPIEFYERCFKRSIENVLKIEVI